MANTVDITEASFSYNVLNNEKTVLVDFWAPWCGPCKAIAPVLDEIAGQHPDTISVAKVDIDANPGIAQTYQVLSIPTIIVFRGGEPVKRITGAKSKKALLKALVDYVG
jgi:thioredoxin 1